MRRESITFLSRGDSLTALEGLVGLLVECAPDVRWLPPEPVGLTELLGPVEKAKRAGAALVHKLLQGEPQFDGVRHLYALKEILIQAATEAYRALHLHCWLQRQGIKECRFHSPNPIAHSLRQIALRTGGSYVISEPPPPKKRLISAVSAYVHRTGREGLAQIPRLTLHRLLPLVSRAALHRKYATGEQGAWWFYSTFYTFTNIGLAYEQSLNRKFRYMIADPGSAEKPLKNAHRDWTEIYAYLNPSQIPSESELKRIRQELRTHLLGTALSENEQLVRHLLMESADFSLVLERLMPLGCLQARAFDKWIECERPAMLVVGNDAQEGYLLQKARTAGLRTVLLQHGILGDFYQLTEHSADVLAVRGEFWREFVSEQSSKRSVVLNCKSREQTARGTSGRDLLFVTTDYNYHRAFHLEDLADILRECVRAAVESERTLVIRIHPRESSALYRQVVERLASEGFRTEVKFSQGPGLDDVISNSAVAVLYSSTVFLDCLRLGVPIVSFDWHHFAYKDQLKHHGVFAFAENLENLHSLLRDGLSGRLTPVGNYDDFLAPVSEEAIKTFFEGAVSVTQA
jgi:hypothetical protein